MTTRISLTSGDTLLLGGLVQLTKRNDRSSVPFLGAIPVLGRLFRNDVGQDHKNNLVILMTVTILDDDKPATGLEKRSHNKANDLEGKDGYLRRFSEGESNSVINAADSVTNAVSVNSVATNAHSNKVSAVTPVSVEKSRI